DDNIDSYRQDRITEPGVLVAEGTSAMGLFSHVPAGAETGAQMNEATDWREWMRGLGRQLRRVREFLGLSQDQVAQLAGVSQGAVSRLEAGRGLATPLVVVLKVHLVLSRALRAFDPALPDEEVRA